MGRAWVRWNSLSLRSVAGPTLQVRFSPTMWTAKCPQAVESTPSYSVAVNAQMSGLFAVVLSGPRTASAGLVRG